MVLGLDALANVNSLTHNQTRFLMSEFTRQAHPDAAHRERLSKEIPGLTPRQVQVWFQNRFAFPFPVWKNRRMSNIAQTGKA